MKSRCYHFLWVSVLLFFGFTTMLSAQLLPEHDVPFGVTGLSAPAPACNPTILVGYVNFAYTGASATPPASWNLNDITKYGAVGANNQTITSGKSYTASSVYSTGNYSIVKNPSTMNGNGNTFRDSNAPGGYFVTHGASNNTLTYTIKGLNSPADFFINQDNNMVSQLIYYVRIRMHNFGTQGGCNAVGNNIEITFKNQSGNEFSIGNILFYDAAFNRGQLGKYTTTNTLCPAGNTTGNWGGWGQINVDDKNSMLGFDGATTVFEGAFGISAGRAGQSPFGTDDGFQIVIKDMDRNGDNILGIESIEVYGCLPVKIEARDGIDPQIIGNTFCENGPVDITASGAGFGNNIVWKKGETLATAVTVGTGHNLHITAPQGVNNSELYWVIGEYATESIRIYSAFCCSALGETTEVFKETFPLGTPTTSCGTANISALVPNGGTTTYNYSNGCTLNENYYAIATNSYWSFWGNRTQVNEHTGTAGSGMLMINAGAADKYFYERQLANVCANTQYEFSAWYNSIANGSEAPSNITFEIWDDQNKLVESGSTSDFGGSAAGAGSFVWRKKSITFTSTTASNYYVKMKNGNGATSGNDLLIDDISVIKCVPTLYLYQDGTNNTSASVCSSDPVKLSVALSDAMVTLISSGSGTVYAQLMSSTNQTTWSAVGTTQSLTGSGTVAFSITPPATAGQKVYYRVKISANQGRAADVGLALTDGCYNDVITQTFDIQKNGDMSSFTVPDAQSLCEGAPLSLTATTGTIGIDKWGWVKTYPDLVVLNNTNSKTFSIASTTPADAGTYYFVVSNAAETCKESKSVVVTVNPIPAAPTVTPVSYCIGGNASALTATGSNLKWYNDDTTPTALAGAPTPLTAATTDSRSYWVSQTVKGCESPRAEIVVTITNTPVPAQVLPPYVACAVSGTPITWASRVETSGTQQWFSDAAGTQSVTLTTFDPNVAQQTSYWVVVTDDDSGCKTSLTEVSVTVHELPKSVVQVTQAITCPGASDGAVGLVSNNGAAPFTYSWKNASGTQVSNQQTASNLPAGTYTLTITDDNGCSATSDPVTLADGIDTQVPNISGSVPPQTAGCDFKVPDLRNLVRAISSDNCTAQSALVITQNPAIGTVISQDTPVTVTVADASGNKSTIDIPVNVLTLPAITFDPIESACANSTSPIQLSASNDGGFPGTFSGIGVSGATFNPSTAGAGTHVITYTITPYGCVMTETQTATVYPVPTNIVVNAPNVCPEATLTASATPSTYDRYEWTVNGVPDPTQTGSVYTYDQDKLPEEQITFSVVAVSDKNCYSTPATATATINAVPGITLVPQPIFCVAERGKRIIWRDFVAVGEHNRVQWYETDNAQTPIVPDNIDQSVAGTHTLYAAAVSAEGCMSTALLIPVTVTVHENPVLDKIDTADLKNIRLTVSGGEKPYIYDIEGTSGSTDGLINLGFMSIGKHSLLVIDNNGCRLDTFVPILEADLIPDTFFTPNNDDRNDLWNITNLEYYLDDDITISIFDRTGKELLRSKAHQFKGWDGKYAGKELPSTDYWYVITIGKLGKQLTGSFSLRR